MQWAKEDGIIIKGSFINDVTIFQRGVVKNCKNVYRKVAITSPSCFEAHEFLFRLLMKDIFDAYVL